MERLERLHHGTQWSGDFNLLARPLWHWGEGSEDLNAPRPNLSTEQRQELLTNADRLADRSKEICWTILLPSSLCLRIGSRSGVWVWHTRKVTQRAFLTISQLIVNHQGSHKTPVLIDVLPPMVLRFEVGSVVGGSSFSFLLLSVVEMARTSLCP